MSERIQHRGLDSETNEGLPNSFESFRERFGQQIEADVFLLKDGNMVILHNKDFGLTQEQVENMTLKQVEELDIRNRKGGEGGRVPFFEEFLFNCLDRGNGLNVEIKASSPRRAEELAEKLVERILEMYKKDKMFSQHPEYFNQLELHSFSIEALEKAKDTMQHKGIEMPLGLFWASTPARALEMEISATAIQRSGYSEGDNWTEKGIEVAEKLGLESINLNDQMINKEIVEKAHKKGLKVYVWIVNDENRIKELEELGVDKIFTEI